jgi:hypothetical protein
MKEVLYKGSWLQKGSVAFSLYTEKKFDLLDKHLKEVDQRWKDLMQKIDQQLKKE